MTKVNKSTNRLVVQGSILAAASLLVRLIGFFYRVPLTNMLGEEGMGYYSGAFTFYSFVLVVSSYAFPSALSKLISKKIALKKYREAHDMFKAALLLGALIGLVTSSLLYFQAEPIAKYIIASEGSAGAIRSLSLALLAFSVLAVFRGYFQGMNTMVPTAFSQIVEQIFNAVFSLLFAFWFLKTDVMMGAAGGTLGTGMGAAFGLLFIILIYMMARPTFKKRMAKDRASTIDGEAIFTYWQIILMTVFPILIGSTAYNLSSLIDMAFFQRALQYHGHTNAYAAAQYGILTAKYILLITLPISIATAIATASIPSITDSIAKKEFMLVKNKATTAIRIVLLVAIPAACGLGFLAKPILLMLFKSDSVDQVAFIMQIGSISVITYSLSAISVGILQGINKMRIPVRNALIGVGVKIFMTIILLYVFDLGLIGAVINGITFGVVIATLNFSRVYKEMHLRLDVKSYFIVPLVSAVIMGVVALLSHMMLMAFTSSNTLSTVIAIMIALVVYGASLGGFGVITEEILSSMPMSGALTKIARKLKWI